MNTVEALTVLGKALCGDSFEVKPGLTDAETILEIAKNYEGGSGGGVRVIDLAALPAVPDDPATLQYEPNLTMDDLIGAHVVFPKENTYERNTIVAAVIPNGSNEMQCKLDSTADAGLIRYNTSTGYITRE